jgi:hypothetical protein
MTQKPWYATDLAVKHLYVDRRLVWVLGPTGAGKSSYATQLAFAANDLGLGLGGNRVLECGSFARKGCAKDATVDTITAHTLACLDRDPAHFAKRIAKQTKTLRARGGGIVVGARNPIDFATAFSVKEDAVVILDPAGPGRRSLDARAGATIFERRGLRAIEAFLDFLVDTDQLHESQVLYLRRVPS